MKDGAKDRIKDISDAADLIASAREALLSESCPHSPRSSATSD